jgi:hypothetical protein
MAYNTPIGREDQDEVTEDLHELAGLICMGENSDGELEYVGSQKQLAKYEELTKKE